MMHLLEQKWLEKVQVEETGLEWKQDFSEWSLYVIPLCNLTNILHMHKIKITKKLSLTNENKSNQIGLSMYQTTDMTQ